MRKILPAAFYLTFFLYVFLPQSFSQSIQRSVICSSGQTVNTSSLSLTYIVGETVADLYEAPAEKRFLTAGFAQPDIELKEILNNKSLTISVFPNPAREKIKIGLNNLPDANYKIELFDISGKIMQTMKVPYGNNNLLYVEMNIQPYSAGCYIILITNDKNYRGQLQLIKY